MNSEAAAAVVLSEAERKAAERLLSEAQGSATRVVSAEPIWGRQHVLRLTDEGGGSSVLKRYAKRQGNADGRSVFSVELASLEILADMPVPVAPRLVGHDPDTLVLVMEDLPPGRSLADSLLLGTEEEVRAGLLAYGTSLGAVHAWTLGRSGEFNSLRRRYAPDSELRSFWVVLAEAGRGQLNRLAGELGMSAAAVDRDLTEVLEILQGDRYSCFIHADACPDNVRVIDGTCRLFDFEVSAAGCATLDFGYLVAPFPSCWCFGPLPDELAHEAQAAYWKTFSASGAVPGDAWKVATAAALACYLVSRVGGLEDFLAGSLTWGTTTGLPRLLMWATAALACAETAEVFPGLRSVFSHLRERASSAMTASAVPQYPALAAPGAELVQVPEWWQEGL